MTKSRFLILLALAAVVGFPAGRALMSITEPFRLDTRAQNALADIFLRADIVVDKTTTPRYAQQKVWLYDMVAQERIKLMTRQEADAAIAAKLYPNVAIVSMDQRNVYNFPERQVTIVLDMPPVATATLASASRSPTVSSLTAGRSNEK